MKYKSMIYSNLSRINLSYKWMQYLTTKRLRLPDYQKRQTSFGQTAMAPPGEWRWNLRLTGGRNPSVNTYIRIIAN